MHLMNTFLNQDFPLDSQWVASFECETLGEKIRIFSQILQLYIIGRQKTKKLYIKSQLKLEKIEVSTRHGICTKHCRQRRKKMNCSLGAKTNTNIAKGTTDPRVR